MSNRTGRGFAGKPNSKKQHAIRRLEAGESREAIMASLGIGHEYMKQIENEHFNAGKNTVYRAPSFDGWYFGDDNLQVNDRAGRHEDVRLQGVA